jgi:hypothetical protein
VSGPAPRRASGHLLAALGSPAASALPTPVAAQAARSRSDSYGATTGSPTAGKTMRPGQSSGVGRDRENGKDEGSEKAIVHAAGNCPLDLRAHRLDQFGHTAHRTGRTTHTPYTPGMSRSVRRNSGRGESGLPQPNSSSGFVPSASPSPRPTTGRWDKSVSRIHSERSPKATPASAGCVRRTN